MRSGDATGLFSLKRTQCGHGSDVTAFPQHNSRTSHRTPRPHCVQMMLYSKPANASTVLLVGGGIDRKPVSPRLTNVCHGPKDAMTKQRRASVKALELMLSLGCLCLTHTHIWHLGSRNPTPKALESLGQAMALADNSERLVCDTTRQLEQVFGALIGSTWGCSESSHLA